MCLPFTRCNWDGKGKGRVANRFLDRSRKGGEKGERKGGGKRSEFSTALLLSIREERGAFLDTSSCRIFGERRKKEKKERRWLGLFLPWAGGHEEKGLRYRGGKTSGNADILGVEERGERKKKGG